MKPQNKLALKLFDSKRMYMIPMKNLLWVKHTQKGDCQGIFGLKLIGLYSKEITENESNEDIFWSMILKRKIKP